MTVIDSKAPIFCAMIDRLFRCQAKGFFVFLYTTSNKRPQALSLIIRTCVYFEILFDIYLDRSIHLLYESDSNSDCQGICFNAYSITGANHLLGFNLRLFLARGLRVKIHF